MLPVSVTAREEYNDNIFFDESGKTDDLITTVGPAIKFKRFSERMEAFLGGRVEFVLYNENDALDETDQSYDGGLRYVVTDRLTMGGTAAFIRDSRPDRDIETTGLVLTNTVRERQSYQLDAQYRLTENNSLGIAYSSADDEFDDDEFDDFRSQQLSIGFFRYITPDTTVNTQVGYTHYDFPQADVDNYSATLGASSRLTETITGTIDLGGRYTTSEFDAFELSFDPISLEPRFIAGEKEAHETGFVGQMGLSYSGELTKCQLNLEHDIQAASGQSGTTQRTGLTYSLERRFMDNLSGYLTGSLFFNQADESEFSSKEIDERAIRTQPPIRYRFSDRLSLDAAYSYTRVEDDVDSTTSDSNVFWIRLTTQYDLFE